VSFDPDIPSVLQYATNFFASAYPIARIMIGIAIGGFVIATLISLVWRARS
jgi:hypoxanthine phosphoribosyltransferase